MKFPDNIKALQCTICGKTYSPDTELMVCPDHGNEGILEVEYDYDLIAKRISPDSLKTSSDYSQWRYRPLMPVLEKTEPPGLQVGWTPLVEVSKLSQVVGTGKLLVKDDSRQPTGSLKDRASALAVMKAKETEAAVITTASTGNAAAALSGMCAAASMECVIFVPKSAPRAKIAQLLAYGAHVYLVDGTYDEAFELCLAASDKFGWYNRNTGYNPYMAEGKKTAAYEICEQSGWQVPDQVFVSVGDGCIISGLYKGFNDLFKLGWIEQLPQLIGVQSAGSDYMCRAAEQHADIVTFPSIVAKTIADSISAGLPRDRIKAERAVRLTKGQWLRVSDNDILKAIPTLATTTGIFAEPAAAAPLAGLFKAKEQGLTGPDHTVVLLVTGSGLKDADATLRACSLMDNEPKVITPSISAVEQQLPKIT